MIREPTHHDYRHMTPRELCAACRAPATTACPRCAAPCCEAHAPAGQRRCVPCEAEFARRRPDPDRLLDLLTYVWLGVMSVLFVIGVADELLWWAGAPIAAVGSWLVIRALRGRFLLERKRPRAELMSTPDREDDRAARS